MKKITGKALSLVLSLALVVSSFSVSLASASTRTADGIVSGTNEDSIYLVNGGSGDGLKSPELIADYIVPVLQTKTRDEVDTIKVDAISHVSGDSLVTLSTNSDNTEAYLKLKSKSVSGTEVISILYEGSYTDADGNDYTIKARKNFTVTVYDKDTPVVGEIKDSHGDPSVQPDTLGEGLDDLATFAQTRNTEKTVGLYLAEPNDGTGTTSALVKFSPIYVTTNKNGVDNDKGTYTADFLKTQAYYLEITDGKNDLHFKDSGATKTLYDGVSTIPTTLQTLNDNSADALQLVSGSGTLDANGSYPKDAGTTNVTLTLKRLTTAGKVSTSSDDKYTFKSKIEKKINVAQAYANDPDVTANGIYTVQKKDGQTRLIGVVDPLSSDGKATTPKYLNVTDAVLDFPEGTTSVSIGDDTDSTNTKSIVGYVGELTIGEDAHVGDINIKDGTVDVNGKVANITTDTQSSTPANSTVGPDGSVLVEGSATAGNIDTTNDANATVTINGGTVGAVTTKSTVSIDGQDSDNNITTGVITAVGGTIYSDEAKISLGGLKAKNDNGTFYLEGDSVTVKSVDLDSRTTTLQLGDTDVNDEAFTGTLPAIQNASNATIKTENEDTDATISGDVNANEISLDSDTHLTLTGNTQAASIDGDGTLTIPAGKLYVTDSVSSTRLKLSDATLAVGTTVFTAKADTVNEDDFTPYGFTLAKTEGNTTDTFKIASLEFAGPQITGTASELLVGQTGTYTATAYPTGTSIPDGYTVEWSLDGGSTDVFTLTSNGNTATVKVNSVDPTFASENKTSLTATLYDADGYEADDYDPATYNISAVTALTSNYKSDTTGTVNMKVGGTYQFKITSADGSQPSFGIGGGGAVVTSTAKSGNDYFYKVTGLKVGQYGVYVGSNTVRTAILNITSSATIDTTVVTIKKGNTYQFKVTSPVKPTFGLGSGIVALTSSSVSGTNYFYKVKAAGGNVGDKVGVYVDGARLAIITIG